MEPDGRMLVAIVSMLSGVAVIGTFAWAYVERLKLRRGDPKQVGEVSERLARIENAIETMSVEVERISEGQRFATNLLAERSTHANATSSRAPRPNV